jgi:serine/threonine-protein kinase
MDESAIFDTALKKPAGTERESFLDEVCGDDRELRGRLEALLEAHDNPESFLENPAEHVLEGAEPEETLLVNHDEVLLADVERERQQVGPYKLLQQIGEGGMGIVFMAEQTEPVKRRVALKIIKPGMDSREIIARFEAERQALAMMDHPNIARVLDAGTTSQGRPFFVMEFVNGLPINKYCDEHNLSTAARLDLFVAVCRGVQHAHQKGVIHRDLKPGNILVADYDDVPVPKVIDFGVAKATNQQLTEKTLFTQLGQVVGTIEYMSPEQAKRNQLDVDTRSDVYSLGIVLYELLTGETPIDKERLRSSAFDEMLRIIREEEPPLPSLKLSRSQEIAAVASCRSVEPNRLTAIVRGDLDWIVLKTLQKERSQRYATPLDLAEDVSRYLTDRPIFAGPPRMVTRLKKFAKRNSWPLLVGTTAVVLLLLAAAWYGHTSQAAARQIADRSQRTSEAIEAASLAVGQAITSPVSSSAEWTAADASLQRVKDLIAEGEVSASVEVRANSLIENANAARTERDIATRLENVLITSASHPDRQSWLRMEREIAAIFTDHGFDVDNEDPMKIGKQIRDHQFAVRFADVLEMWIATRAYYGESRDELAPWTEAIYVADTDPLRTGIRRILYTVNFMEGERVKPEQIEEITRGVDLESHSPRTITWLASLYGFAGMPDEQLRLLRDTLRQHPTDVMLNFENGWTLAQEKHWHEASRMYSRAIALRPDAAGLWQMMGLALTKAEDLDGAREAFERACELEDDYGPTWVNLGDVLLKQQQAEEAIGAGRRAIDLMPDQPGGYGVVGRGLMQQEKYKEALPILEKCDEVRKNDPRWRWPSKRWIAQCKQRLRRVAAGDSAPQSATTDDPDSYPWPHDGVWKPIAAVHAGVRLSDEEVRAVTLRISGKTYEVTVEGEDEPDRGTYTLDTSTRPRRMTLKSTEGPNQGKTILAIYEMKDEVSMRVCYDLSGKEFPEDFRAPKGSQRYAAGYRRQKG